MTKIRSYLTQRDHGLPPGQDLEAAWTEFYKLYARKIRAFAFRCGATDEEIADCVQEVWRELLVRLPVFELDCSRGQFDNWLFHIVRGKAIDLRRLNKHHLLQENAATLQTVADERPAPGLALEEEELVALAWEQLRQRLTECNFQVLRLRLVEQWTVAAVAEKLVLSHEQVWYRYHRARRELEEIGLALTSGQRLPRSNAVPL